MQKNKLKNGLKYILVPTENTEAVSVLVLVKVGSRYEKPGEEGMAHFLEHMIFKGTKQRPDTLTISRELDSLGADFNAYTTVDHTGFWIKVSATHLEEALDILSDIIFNSTIKAKEIEKERGTILEEMNMYEDDPKKNSINVLYDILFAGSTLGKDEIGTKESVAGINANMMKNFKQRFYTPNNMIVGVAGNFDTDTTDELIAKYFNRHQKTISKTGYKKFANKQQKPQVVIKQKQTEQIHMSMGFHGLGYDNDALDATKILSTVLGGSMSSRLFINIREKHGLCYYIRSGLGIYEDTGSFVIQAGLDKKRLLSAIKAIAKEIKKIKTSGITLAELKRAKEIIKGGTVLQLEDSSSVADWYTRQYMFGRQIKTPAEKLTDINQVTKQEVDAVARQLFKKNNFNLAIINDEADGLQTKILNLLDF